MQKLRRKFGRCSLCGLIGQLSFEHVPPRSAFNNQRVMEADIHRLFSARHIHEIEKPSGKYNQLGAGGFTLCAGCNNKTGDWYAASYIGLARSLYGLTSRLTHGQVIRHVVQAKPHNVLKQILVMFCSACGPDFAQKNPDLVRYLLNRSNADMPDRFRIFISLFDRRNSFASRQSGITGRLSLGGDSNVYSEICFPPFNLIMAIGSPSPDARPYEITWFNRFHVDSKQDVTLELQILPVVTYIPGDYRTVDEVKAGMAMDSDHQE